MRTVFLPRLSLHKRQLMSRQQMRLVGEDRGGEVDLLSVEGAELIEGVEAEEALGFVEGVEEDLSLHPCRHNCECEQSGDVSGGCCSEA